MRCAERRAERFLIGCMVMNSMDILECIACGHKARFYADGSINAFVDGTYLCNKCWDTLEEYLKEHFDEVVNWIKERNGAE